VGEQHLAALLRRLHLHQPVRLGLHQRLAAELVDHLREPQRLAEREQLDCPEHGIGHLGHARADELSERRARRRAPRQPPEPGGLRQRAALERAHDQLAHVEDVALAALVDPAPRHLLDRSAERRLGQLARLALGQRPQVDPGGARVLPQRHDRVGTGLARAHRRDDERGAGQGEVEHERGGGGIEQVSVVDADLDPPSGGALVQRVRAAAHELERVVGPHVAGEEAGQRAERDGRRAARRVDPLDQRAALARLVDQLPGEPRLADTGGTHQHDAGRAVEAAGGPDPLELVRAPDERPALEVGGRGRPGAGHKRSLTPPAEAIRPPR
jgi:hypothetical protein